MEIPPRRLVISGGGMRAVAHIGAVQVLEERGLMKGIKECIGVSAGAMFSFCLCIGYTMKEIEKIITEFDFQLIRSISAETLMEFPTAFGIDDGANLLRFLHSLMKQRGIDPNVTFADLQTKKSFRCYATDLCTCTYKEFSKEKTPNVKVTTALQASMCLPSYFVPIQDPETGHMLVDGGVINNYPMSFLSVEEQAESIGLSFSYNHTTVDEIPEIGSFFMQIFACYYMPRARETEHMFAERTILVPKGHYPAWNFEASDEERQELIAAGKKAALDFFAGLRTKAPPRRYSVS
jgi:predicted acylesterase/phospholipase RssA